MGSIQEAIWNVTAATGAGLPGSLFAVGSDDLAHSSLDLFTSMFGSLEPED